MIPKSFAFNFFYFVYLFLFFGCIDNIYCDENEIQKFESSVVGSRIIPVALILLGLILGFFGYRLFKPTIFLIGFF